MNNTSKILSILALFFASCQQEGGEEETPVAAEKGAYDLKEYKVERHPPVVRNGFGMDIYHSGGSELDTLYLDTELPPWHPNNPTAEGSAILRRAKGSGEPASFEYDLLFYNEYAYTPQVTGDYSNTGFPVIFMYADPANAAKSTKAAMVGQGIACFSAFTADSIARHLHRLRSDSLVNLDAHRTEIHSKTVNGKILLRENAEALYNSLVIGNKFRPNVGHVFDLPDVSDEAQVAMQPVFLVQTREGLFAKFMVTRFKGVGMDTQKANVQWQALKTE
ncbi:MAG: hypothetical protein LBO71_05435 [Prevotellaceae bacterium]|nr:hypothetical protein [Prevotellaceae bacterium]